MSTGYAGSIQILVSPVIHTGTGVEIKPLLVADPAYKLTSWCVKPYPETAAITPRQIDFNKTLHSARVVVEQAFGMLKRSWHCLLLKLDESIDKNPRQLQLVFNCTTSA